MLVKCIDAGKHDKLKNGDVYEVLKERGSFYDLKIDGYADSNCTGFFKTRFVEVYENTVTSTSDVPTPDRVIFNGQATIIFWSDGDKTLVKKTDDDVMDAEKAFLVSFYEKMSGLSRAQCNKTLGRIVTEYDAQTVDNSANVVFYPTKLRCVSANERSMYNVGDVYDVIYVDDAWENDDEINTGYIIDRTGGRNQLFRLSQYRKRGMEYLNWVTASGLGFEIVDGEA